MKRREEKIPKDDNVGRKNAKICLPLAFKIILLEF